MSATPLRLDHLALPVYDAARTLHFYTEVLQLPLVDALSGDDWGGKPWLMMFFGTGSGQLLALSALAGAQPPRPDGLPADVRHYAFSVSSGAEQEQWEGAAAPSWGGLQRRRPRQAALDLLLRSQRHRAGGHHPAEQRAFAARCARRAASAGLDRQAARCRGRDGRGMTGIISAPAPAPAPAPAAAGAAAH